MATRDILDKLPECVRTELEHLRKDYKNEALNHDAALARSAGYAEGLRDAGLITERERQFVFIYTTV